MGLIAKSNSIFRKLFLTITKNINYFYASIFSFCISIIILNILNFLVPTLVAAKLTLIFIFFLNFLILLKYYKIKKKKKTLFILFILSSLFFRIIEFYSFKFGLVYISNINLLWISVFFLSNMVKFFFYNIVLTNKIFHHD